MAQVNVSKRQKPERERILCTLRSALLEVAGCTARGHNIEPTWALDLVNKFACAGRLATEMLDLSAQQGRALCSMQEYIDFMHTLAPRVWSETAADDHACWQQLKEMAEEALAAFGWAGGASVEHRSSAV